MLAKILSSVRRGAVETAAFEVQPAQLPVEAIQFGPMVPMVPLQPPPAHNDHGMRRVCEEVEKALRAAGHLR